MKHVHVSPLLVVALAMILVFAVACDRPEPQVVLDTPPPATPQQPQTVGNPTPTLPPVAATAELGVNTPGAPVEQATPEVSPLAPPTAEAPGQPTAQPQVQPTAQPQVQPTVAPQPQTPATPQAPGGVYTVKPGDTLFSVGRAFGINPYAIAAANHLPYPYTIYPGQQLIIPGTSPVPPGPTAVPPGPAPVPPKPGCRYYYVVRPGDNLFRISLAFGVPMSTIATANGIYNYNLIYAGQTLCIP